MAERKHNPQAVNFPRKPKKVLPPLRPQTEGERAVERLREREEGRRFVHGSTTREPSKFDDR